MAENMLLLSEVVLLFVIIIGVGYVIVEFLKHLVDKKNLEAELEELNTDFVKFQESTIKNLNHYKNSYSLIQNQTTEQTKNTIRVLEKSDKDVEQILEIADKLIDLNENLYDKVVAIDDCLVNEGTISKDHIEKLVAAIHEDIEKKKEYKQRIEKYKLDREERTQKRLLQKGLDLER